MATGRHLLVASGLVTPMAAAITPRWVTGQGTRTSPRWDLPERVESEGELIQLTRDEILGGRELARLGSRQHGTWGLRTAVCSLWFDRFVDLRPRELSRSDMFMSKDMTF